MSLILDALNKADQERQKNNGAPSLHDTHEQSMPQNTTRQNGLLIYALIAMVVLLCSALGFIFWQQLNTNAARQNSAAPQTTVNSTNPANSTTTNPSITVNSNATQNSAPATPQTAAELENTAKEKLKQSAKYKEMQEKLIASQYERAKEEAEQPTIAVQTPAATPKATPVTAPRPTRAPRSVVDQVVSTSNPLPKTNTLADHPFLGSIRDLPNYVQQEIPTLTYSAHNYYGAGAGSTVVLNKKTLSYGDQVIPELYIKDILEDGIVLRYKTHQFKLKALSSWVNI